MTEEIGTKDGMSDVRDEKNPSEGPAESQVRVWDVVPKVAMLELLTAWSGGPAGREERDNWATGKTLTSAPLSTKRRRPLVQSVTKNRRLGDSREVLVAINTRPGCFPSTNRGRRTCGRCHQTGDDTSRGWQMGGSPLGVKQDCWNGGLLPR